MSDSSLLPPTSAPPLRRRVLRRVRALDPVVTVATVLLAAASYVPSFLTKPGFIADDSKQYLYLNPGKLIQSAISMWDPDVGMGTVTHQNIGFLFPMGPYYWVIQQLHIPMWVGQRFWMGSLFFFAGTGVFFLGRLLGLNSWGRVAAGIAYTFTPFVVDYIGRISAIVMPWSALGWMVALVILSVRRGGWRWPALFALVIALVGGVNATSILLAGLAPALWIIHAVFISKEVPARKALAAVLRLGVLSALVSLWWIAGLWAEGSYGLNILRFTETVPTVTSTSLSSEAMRGLGYWFFYGQDKLQPWTSAATQYMSSPWLIGVGFGVPTLCVLVGAFARWRYRAFAVGLLLIGVVAAVAAYPYDNPSPFGRALKAAGSDSTIGLAMRSTNRVIPLIVLGLALLLGSGVSALISAHFKTGLLVLLTAVGLAAADLPPLWTGNLVATNLARPEQLPSYVTQAAQYLNTHGSGRVFEVPGQDFAYYRYGVAGDPVWPGLLNRPYVARQVVPQGEPASVDLLQAIDESIQDGVFVPSTLVPIAQLMSAGDILFSSDEQYERFNTARPQPLWLDLISPVSGLGTPVTFGTPQIYKTITYPLQDETQLAIPTGASIPPPLAVFAVPGARPLVRTESTATPLIVAGSGAGLVNAAAAGLLANNPTILYAASLDHNVKGLDQLLKDGAVLVLTDTNQRQQDTYGTLNDNTGYVEQANVGALGSNPTEASAGPTPSAGSSAQTVTTLSSVASIQATNYGNPITNTSEDRAYNAFDQNPNTRWAEGAFTPATGAVLRVTLKKPVSASEIRLLQPQTGPRNRYITQVTLTFDGRTSVKEKLGKSSRTEPGQIVHFAPEKFRTLDITVDATSAGHRATFDGLSGVGFADVTIPGVAPVVQTLRLPTDLLHSAGAASISHRLVILMNRIRAAPVPPRSDPELDMVRSFSLPTARTFTVGGTARISVQDPDPVIDQIVGRTPVISNERSAGSPAVITFSNSSGRLPGDAAAGAYAAVDGNPATSWMPGFGDQKGNWVQYAWDRPVTFSTLNLEVVADGRHSIPTKLTITGDDGTRVVTLPQIGTGKGRPQGSTTSVPISFAPLTGQQVKITIDSSTPVRQLDYYSDAKQTAPVGFAEIGIPGVVAPPTASQIPPQCLGNLLTVDGTPVDIEISGSASGALSGGGLTISGCGNSLNGIRLSPGSHVIQTAPSQVAGFNLDALSLSSEVGGGPLPTTLFGTIPTTAVTTSPTVHVLHQDRAHLTVSVRGTGAPYWLVLGQSQSRGWQAAVRGGASLGSSTLIDGYANGWLVSGRAASGTTVFTMAWTPQKVVNAAVIASALTVGGSLALVVIPTPLLIGAWEAARRRLPRRLFFRRRRVAKVEDAEKAGEAEKVEKEVPLPYVLATPAVAADTSPAGSLEEDPDARPPDPAVPLLTSVLSTRGRRPQWLVLLGVALLAGGIAGAVTAPIAAPIVFGAVIVGGLAPWTRLLFVFGPVGLLAATGVYMAVREHQQHIATNIEWPAQFPLANSLTWMAVAALLAAAAVEVARWRPWIPDAYAQEEALRKRRTAEPPRDEDISAPDEPPIGIGVGTIDADDQGDTDALADERAAARDIEEKGDADADIATDAHVAIDARTDPEGEEVETPEVAADGARPPRWRRNLRLPWRRTPRRPREAEPDAGAPVVGESAHQDNDVTPADPADSGDELTPGPSTAAEVSTPVEATEGQADQSADLEPPTSIGTETAVEQVSESIVPDDGPPSQNDPNTTNGQVEGIEDPTGGTT